MQWIYPICKGRKIISPKTYELATGFISFFKMNILLPAATKLGQGNKFTGVCLSTGGGVPGLVPGGYEICWQVGQKFGGGGGGGSPNFFSFFFSNYFFLKKSFWDAPPPPETVNARPVRILLECILVFVTFATKTTQWEEESPGYLLIQLEKATCSSFLTLCVVPSVDASVIPPCVSMFWRFDTAFLKVWPKSFSCFTTAHSYNKT